MDRDDRVKLGTAFHEECVRALQAAQEAPRGLTEQGEDTVVADRLGVPVDEYARHRRCPPEEAVIWAWVEKWHGNKLPGHAGRTADARRRWNLKRAFGHEKAWEMVPGQGGRIAKLTGPIGRPRVTRIAGSPEPYGLDRLTPKQRATLSDLFEAFWRARGDE